MERQFSGRRPRIVIAGSGNVASHLAPALDCVGDVVQVWSRDFDHAYELSSQLRGADAVSDIKEIISDADFYIISVSDDAIPSVAKRLSSSGVSGIVAHTSGTFRLEQLQECLGESIKAGVFYPLQTFSKSVDIDLTEVPFFIEGSDPETLDSLIALARSVSDDVRVADSAIRGNLHVAAVFANNFANYVWDVADNYLRRHTDMDITVFKPLLTETLRKAVTKGPRISQTGPACRGDETVMKEHLAKLNEDEREVYNLLSDKIMKIHRPKPEI